MNKTMPVCDIDIWGGPMVGFRGIEFKGFAGVR